MSSQSRIAEATLRHGSSISLLALPLLLATAFALHFDSFGRFLDLTATEPAFSPESLTALLTGPDGGWRFYQMPHYLGYLTLPFFISTALVIARTIWARQPLIALAGAGMTIIGTVFMGGVFGAWLSFVPVSTLGEGTLPALTVLTAMSGALAFSTILSGFSLLGLIVLGIGLILARLIPLWAGALFTLGNVVIVAFIDVDNWMFVGAMMMLAGIWPLSRHIYGQGSPKSSALPATV